MWIISQVQSTKSFKQREFENWHWFLIMIGFRNLRYKLINCNTFDCVVAQLVASLLHDPKCGSSSPTQTRIKFPCFYLQLTITMVIVDGANLKVLELSGIGNGLNKVKMHLGSLGSCCNSIKTSVWCSPLCMLSGDDLQTVLRRESHAI